RHTRFSRDWSSDVCSSDLQVQAEFGVDRADASLPYTATMVGFAAGNVIVGGAIDRFGYWLPALFSSIGLGAGFLLAAATSSILRSEERRVGKSVDVGGRGI